VSLTPLALDADSRAFRIASSLADAGFRSVVIEGRPSASRFWGSNIEVHGLGRAEPAAAGADRGIRPRQCAVDALRSGRLGRVGELALYGGFRAWDWRRHRRGLGRRLPPAAIYYLHSFEHYRAVAPVAARLGAAVIYDAHDFYRGIEAPERQPSFDRRFLRPFLNRIEDRLVAEADAVVTVSDGVADLMGRSLGRRPVVIRNCHDERLDRPITPDLRTALRLSGQERLIVVVGNCKPGMAIALAADAMALLPPQFHLAFVGRGYAIPAQRLRHHPAAARVHFGHHAEPNTLVPFIRSGDLGLVIYEPCSDNYRNALPNGFFQTVAAGLPLVRLPLPEIEAAIAGRAIGLRVEHAGAADLAHAIRQCADHPEAFRRNTAALAQTLRWEDESSRLRQLVETVIKRPATRAAVPFAATAGVLLRQ
jgi:glycosyltransferase involved in cell wall biosynthesis